MSADSAREMTDKSAVPPPMVVVSTPILLAGLGSVVPSGGSTCAVTLRSVTPSSASSVMSTPWMTPSGKAGSGQVTPSWVTKHAASLAETKVASEKFKSSVAPVTVCAASTVTSTVYVTFSPGAAGSGESAMFWIARSADGATTS
jgi:hypothetical protein